RRLTRGSGFWLVNKACSVVPVFHLLGLGAQTCWTAWPQPIPCLSAIQWHAGNEGSQPEKDTTEVQYIMSGVASVVDSDGRRLTRGSGF
uniref:AMP-binding domain-containing protein n=1 Tax=Mesocestoides corti TaxID=53468 RepID=A0A5K3G2S7_MESCO